jgi:phosphoesterase RecJ-like protein
MALKHIGKEVIIANADGIPPLYSFLPRSETVNTKIAPEARFDVALIIECPDIERMGGVINLNQQAGRVINIDHHGDNKQYGDFNWVEPKTAAVGEQIYRLILALDARITSEIADCLFIAIYTDTGGFSYSNTEQASFQIAAELMRYDLDPHHIVGILTQQYSIARMKLLGQALSTLETTLDGRVAWIQVTDEMMKKTGAQKYETEGFVDYPRALKNVEVAVFFRETEKGEIKVSLRSKGIVDVSAIAHQFKGGGHFAAAGFTLQGPLNQAKEKILKEIGRSI